MLLNNFIEYVKIDTQSDEGSFSTPSTLKQLDLLNLLKSQLDKLGVENEIDEFGRLYGHLPGNKELTSIGLCAHVDTASECSDKNVNPQIIKNYDLQDIPLGKSGLILSPNEYKKLNECKDKTIICTDGTTLLGADDKAGIAIIMEVVERVLKFPLADRHPLSILFTPDEEIGRGADHFDANKFGCEYAFTFDGSSPLEICYENFNAKSAEIVIKGKSIHPGDAKGVMVNASLILMEFISMLPQDLVPSKTSGREGFNHLCDFSGNVELASASYIIRNHSKQLIEEQAKEFEEIKDKLLQKYPTCSIELNIKDQYKNMYEIIKDNPKCLNHIKDVFKRLNLDCISTPIRGGTDGATFSYKNVPTPNLGTGSYNHHGRYEFAVLEEMELLVDIGVELIKNEKI